MAAGYPSSARISGRNSLAAPGVAAVLALLALLAPCAAYYQPGDPPQCLDGYQCIFQRSPTPEGLSLGYTWDLRPLCAAAGGEYVAGRDTTCLVDANGICPSRCNNDCKADKSQKIRFNVCGTVSGPVAPVNEDGCPDGQTCTNGVGSPQEIPIPASHGVAVQVRGSQGMDPCCAGPAL